MDKLNEFLEKEDNKEEAMEAVEVDVCCGEVCGDNRFEIIAKAKELLLERTNIESSPDEMKVLDSLLFRCWQMGWLDKVEERLNKENE